MDVHMVERCLHDRAALAFAAARSSRLPGRFLTFEIAGLLETLATDPSLNFLNRVEGVTTATVDGLAEVLAVWDELAVPLPSVMTTHADAVVDERLRGWGFVPAGQRPVAVIDLARAPQDFSLDTDAGFEVREARSADERQTFLDVLAVGYASSTPVRNFMSAEHSVNEVRRFVGWHGGQPMAAAAMSAHRNVVVLGGAAVLRDARGRGGQMQLLRHRVHEARIAGREAAIATAAPDSSSLRNLQQAGFDVTLRRAWREPAPPSQRRS